VNESHGGDDEDDGRRERKRSACQRFLRIFFAAGGSHSFGNHWQTSYVNVSEPATEERHCPSGITGQGTLPLDSDS